MLLSIHHQTTYRYAAPVSDSYVEARLQPWSDADQGCVDFSLVTTPATRISHCRTPLAWVHFFNLLPPHETLRLVSRAAVITMPRNPFDRLELRGEDWPLLRDDTLRARLWEYLQPPDEPEVAQAAGAIIADLRRETGNGVALFLLELARYIHVTCAFDPRATTVTTPLSEVLTHRRGVCQDFSHLMIAVARSAGIAARYVSGYLHVEEEADARADDGGAMHAWVEAYVPTSGWVGFDPTHGLLVDHHYVKVGVGRSYHDVPPTRGMFRGPGEHNLEVVVRVTPEARERRLWTAGSLREPAPVRSALAAAGG
jgi:transglutaminase-like putative cysteine protease